MGFLIAIETWTKLFENALPEGINGFVVDVVGSCGSENTFGVDGQKADFIGTGDVHDTRYDDLAIHRPVVAFEHAGIEDECSFSLAIYPSRSFEEEYYTKKPWIYSTVVFLMFVLTAMSFHVYDIMVRRQQDRLISTAARTRRIVTSLFPEKVGERLLEKAKLAEETGEHKKKPVFVKSNLKDFLASEDSDKTHTEDPIADFFSETTIMFADISGFTAWSSTREPKQVFALLEAIFHEFDSIARRRRVFKVETVGDCYVAVAGLPEPRDDHAVIMTRFARDCLFRFKVVSKKLEVELGPSTADLGVRIGLVSLLELELPLCKLQLLIFSIVCTVTTAFRARDCGSAPR